MFFENYPDNSQVWIYGADRFLSATEEIFAKEQLDAFVGQWAAHGTELSAEGAIIFHNFIVIVANENQVKASGCSIDASVRFVKSLGAELGIDFFNRLSVLLEKEGSFKRISFSELSSHKDWNMFDPMVKTLGDFRSNWVVKVEESVFV